MSQLAQRNTACSACWRPSVVCFCWNLSSASIAFLLPSTSTVSSRSTSVP